MKSENRNPILQIIAPTLTVARSLLVPLAATLAALMVGGLVMALIGINPWAGFKAIFEGAFSSPTRIGAALTKATPLILAGLAVALPFRSGILNIGGEGQIYIGALAATLVALGPKDLPIAIHLPLVLLAGFAGGFVWGAIPGWLRAKLKLNELITTIMLNYVGFWIVSYLVHGPIKDPGGSGYPWSVKIPVTAELPILLKSYQINLGLAVALIMAVVSHFLLWRTSFGFEMRAVGCGREAARLAGIDPKRTIILTLAIGGGLAGLAGLAEVMGVQHRLSDFFSPNYGYDAVVVALVGQSSPLGVVIAGLFFGALRSGTDAAARTIALPASIAHIIQALTLLFVIGSNSDIFKRFWQKRRKASVRNVGSTTPVS
ncbi:MAG: ABC transporter permease [Anaerolineales bacterium]|nr:ABC transporter permease [Anaerolineales bacterium]